MLMCHFQRSRKRRAAILVVVVAFLALGLSLGIAFLFYANQQAVNMRIYRDAFQTIDLDDPPNSPDIANEGFKQLIYDLPDDLTGADSALRGCSLARSMYGLYYAGNPTAPVYSNNDIPYNGIGRFHATGNPNVAPILGAGVDAFNLINYQYFRNDGFVIDPERVGRRTDPLQTTYLGLASQNNYIPKNAPYTYPDAKDIYLGAIDPRDGTVLVQSFFRPNIFNQTLNSAGGNWTNRVGKYMIHRPRPADHVGFPAPNDSGGDVSNLTGRTGNSDSVWMDIGLPMKKWRGVNYKPLVAWLVVDLDGRLNIHTAGNKVNPGSLHASMQGYGSWEVNLTKIANFNEAQKLLIDPTGKYGSDTTPSRVYYPDGVPLPSNNAQAAANVPFYSAINYDGSGTTTGLSMPTQGQTSPTYQIYPTVPTARYESGAITKIVNHPLVYNPYFRQNVASGVDRTYAPKEMSLLNNMFNGDQVNYQQSELAKLMPNNLSFNADFTVDNVSGNPRYLMTTTSNDLMRPGFSPWLQKVNNAFGGNRFQYYAAQLPGAGGVFPPTTAGQGIVPNQSTPIYPQASTRPGYAPVAGDIDDFNPNSWKSIQSALASIDLNRPLADYRSNPLGLFETVGNVTPVSAALAIADRQRLAQDIFDRLCWAVGADNSAANLVKLNAVAKQGPVATSFIPLTGLNANNGSEFRGLRFLAQLAVNIVDLIDNDDYITPFVWNPTGAGPADPLNFDPKTMSLHVVFGTELPRLVINEAAINVENGSKTVGSADYDKSIDPADPANAAMKGWVPKAAFYVGKVWVELHNPLTPNGASTAALSHGGGAPLTFNGNAVYQLLLTRNGGGSAATATSNKLLRHADNVDGRPEIALTALGTQQIQNKPNFNVANSGNTPVTLGGSIYGANDVVPASTTASYSQPMGVTSSFCLVGFDQTPGDNLKPSFTNPKSANLQNMWFHIETTEFPNYPATGTRIPVDILLQRLLCPHLAPSVTNPYITVDYFQFSGPTGPATSAIVNDLRTVDTSATGTIMPVIAPTSAKSYGRQQPYAGKQPDGGAQSIDLVVAQPGPNPTGMQHSFFQHNGKTGATYGTAGATLTQPFDWLVHFDRPLVSPVELMQVSAVKPHELTKEFINSWGKFQHTAVAPTPPIPPGASPGIPCGAWTCDAYRLFRALPLLETRSRMMGIPHGGREAGRVNINTIWHPDIWNALCDQDPGNSFSQANVTALWNSLLASRSGGSLKPSAGVNDRPFWGLGAPIDAGAVQFPTVAGKNMGIDFTLLRTTTGNSDFNVPGQTHPYLQKELLNKIYNKTTTRSNVFAVWLTIGYFQVMNSATKPLQLGQEVGIADGTNIRNSFFAIIDRTNLTRDVTNPNVQGKPPVFFSLEPTVAGKVVDVVPAGSTVTCAIPGKFNGVSQIAGTYEDNQWTINNGDTILVDVGVNTVVNGALATGNQEPAPLSVTVGQDAVGNATITFKTTKAHARGCALMINNTILGNPGPQPGFYYLSPTYTPVIPVVVQTQ